MDHHIVPAFCMLLLAALAGPVAGQSPAACPPPGGTPNTINVAPIPPGAVQVLLMPLDEAAEGAPFAGGLGIGAPAPGTLRIDVGLQYLRPQWDADAVTLVIPPGVFTLLADAGNPTHDFAFVPTLAVEYEFVDMNFGLGVSGQVINLSGSLERTLTSADAFGTLNVESSVNIAAVNVLEVSKTLIPCGGKAKGNCCTGLTAVGSLGLRYAQVSQNYAATLTSGPNTSNLTATQDFAGFGLTGTLNTRRPLFDSRWWLYAIGRAWLLMGTNDRSSNFAVVVPDDPALSDSGVVTENETALVPGGSLEGGVAWSKPLGGNAALPGAEGQALLWIRLGLVGQVWGNLGLLTPPTAGDPFAASNLFLVGLTVFAGIDY